MLASTASLAVAGLTALAGAGLPDLVGTLAPPYPAPYSSDQGTCVPQYGDNMCAYTVGTLNTPDGEIVAILAEKSLGHLDDGTSISRIVDMIEVPPIRDMQIYTAAECYLDGELTAGLAAVVQYDDNPDMVSFDVDHSVWAVALDTGSEKLTVIDPDRVECIMPGS